MPAAFTGRVGDMEAERLRKTLRGEVLSVEGLGFVRAFQELDRLQRATGESRLLVEPSAGARLGFIVDADNMRDDPSRPRDLVLKRRGDYQLGAPEVQVRDGWAGLRDEPDTIAGSTIFLPDALRLLQQYGVDESAAVAAATSVPAQAIGRAAHIGLLRENYAADVVIWDEDWEPWWVFADGEPLVQP